ncbi:MAG: hypothetical protein JWP87_5369 [Labilithrix sp.]|nr:hypothetical protein [Labilithrix sp.]
MNAVRGASAAALGRGPVLQAARAGMLSLLPPPGADFTGMGALQDALLVAYAERVKQGANEARSVGADVAQHRQATAIEQKKMTEARERQQAAERASRGFWAKLRKVATSIAKVAALVASAAATIATAGTGAPFAVAVAGLVLSAGGMAVRELKLLGKDSDKIGMALEIGGAVVGVAGAAAGAMRASTEAMTMTARVAGYVRNGAMIAGGVATGAAAVGTVKVADFARDARRAEADAEEARARLEHHQLETHFLIATLQSAMEVERDALAGTSKAIEATNQATEVAIAGVRG